MNTASRPSAHTHSSRFPRGRKPIPDDTTTTMVVAVRLRTRLAATWPVSTAELRIGIERNRSMMPFTMSLQT